MAASEKSTVYTRRSVEIVFSGETVCCARCPLLETYARKQCRITGEYILDERTVGGWCPLVDPDTGEAAGIYYQITK